MKVKDGGSRQVWSKPKSTNRRAWELCVCVWVGNVVMSTWMATGTDDFNPPSSSHTHIHKENGTHNQKSQLSTYASLTSHSIPCPLVLWKTPTQHIEKLLINTFRTENHNYGELFWAGNGSLNKHNNPESALCVGPRQTNGPSFLRGA